MSETLEETEIQTVEVSRVGVIDPNEITTAIAEMEGGQWPAEKVLLFMDRLDAYKRAIAQLIDSAKKVLVDQMAANNRKPIVVERGDGTAIRFTLAPKNKTKCTDKGKAKQLQRIDTRFMQSNR